MNKYLGLVLGLVLCAFTAYAVEDVASAVEGTVKKVEGNFSRLEGRQCCGGALHG